MFHDSVKSISQVDKQLAGYVLEHHKPAIFVVNKWDLLVKDLNTGEFADYLRKVYPESGLRADRVHHGQERPERASGAEPRPKPAQAGRRRVSTGDLNRVLQHALARQPAAACGMNRRAKIFFATQVATHPPTIVLFTNGPELFDNTYQRYLLKMFRDHLPFHDVPIKLHLRGKQRDDAIPTLSDAPAAQPKKMPKPFKLKRRPKAKTRRGNTVG